MAKVFVNIAYSFELTEKPGAARKLASAITKGGIPAALELGPRDERFYVNEDFNDVLSPETIVLVVASAAATTAVNAIVTDVYNKAKTWARGRFEKRHKKLKSRGESGKPVRVIIFDHAGTKLIEWRVDDHGEREYYPHLRSTTPPDDQ